MDSALGINSGVCRIFIAISCSIPHFFFLVEFVVDFVKEFEWNTEAYENLVIPAEQKSVLTTLVESHSSGSASKLDDFVKGKGMGLVINLYGNPGTGRTQNAPGMHRIH